jgi:hypothetical protein
VVIVELGANDGLRGLRSSAAPMRARAPALVSPETLALTTL